MKNASEDSQYVYEKLGGVIYRRDRNNPESSLVAIGWDYDKNSIDGKPITDFLQDELLWKKIRQCASTNMGLRAELERVLTFYRLLESTENTEKVAWHPV